MGDSGDMGKVRKGTVPFLSDNNRDSPQFAGRLPRAPVRRLREVLSTVLGGVIFHRENAKERKGRFFSTCSTLVEFAPYYLTMGSLVAQSSVRQDHWGTCASHDAGGRPHHNRQNPKIPTIPRRIRILARVCLLRRLCGLPMEMVRYSGWKSSSARRPAKGRKQNWTI